MLNFMVMSISYIDTLTSVTVSLTTNNPCHLFLLYTDVLPQRHRVTRTVRGLSEMWGGYWCFVAHKSVEQLEAGDTLTHTFVIPDWSI